MYETYYRLSADPFRLSPDPRFCFEHPSFSRARKYMQYALRRAEGFIMVTGRPGTGKTTLVESLLSGLAGGGPVAARLVTAQLGPDELLRKVAYAFGLNVGGLDKATLLLHLERFLIQQARTGRGALLVIDEAQGLGASSLEELRLLTNLQENARPILQIFLVGQEELRDIVQRPELEQFHQRLIAACHLKPLDPEETQAYVEHRLRRVGWRGDPAITSDAFHLVHRFSAGVPRRINQVCSRLLLHGAAEDRHRLDGRDALAVIEDLRAELLAPADIAETEELRDLLASLPADPEPEPPPAAAPPQASRPHPAREAAGARATGEAGALAPSASTASPPDAVTVGFSPPSPEPRPLEATASPTVPTEPRAIEAVPGHGGAIAPPPAADQAWTTAEGGTWAPEAPPQTSPTPHPPQRPDLEQTQPLPPLYPTGRPHGTVRGDSPLAAAYRPAYRPAAPEPRSRRLAHRILPPLLIVAAAVPLTLALFPNLGSRLQNDLAHWLGGAGPGPEPAAPVTTGPVARRGEPPAVTAPPSVGADPPRAAVSAASPITAFAREPSAPPPAAAEPAPDSRPQSPPRAGDSAPPVPGAEVPPRSEPLRRPEMTEQPALADKPLPAEAEPTPVLDGTRPQSAALVASARETPAVPVASPHESTSLRPASARQESPAPERELARLGVSLSRLADGTVHVNLRRQVPFDFNSAEVRPESRPFLDRLAEALRRLDGFVVRVVGLTDDSGTRDYNAQLSRRRAEAVAAYLRQQGVPPDRLRAEGRGVGEPTAEVGGIADGGADRRRIELYIQPLTSGRA